MQANRFLVLAAGAVFFFHDAAQAQSLPGPKLTHISPVGGQLGSTFEMTVTGSDLDKAEGLHFSFRGAHVEVLGSSAPATPTDMKKKGAAKKDGGPQLSQKFKVTLPAQVPLGIHDVRVVASGGVSNPRAFVVSDMKEILETEPNDNVDKAQKIELNTSISGVVATPTDVDYYQFAGKKGQRVLLSCLTSSVDSKLPVQLEVYNTQDKFLGSSRSYLNNDALLDVLLPDDGNYLVRLSCFTYSLGGPDYFYHLSVTTAPWIDAVVPGVVQTAQEAKITIYGRNLPGGKPDPAAVIDGKMLDKTTLKFKPPGGKQDLQRLSYYGLIMPHASGLDGFELRSMNGGGASNPYLLTFAAGPVTVDNEKNQSPASAQPVQVPGAIAGCIQKKGDRHYYAFNAAKGQVLNFDLLSDRLGAPTDLYFEVFNLKDGKSALVTKQEDTPDNFGIQFPNPSSDPPSYRFVAPADGTFQVLVASLEASAQYGPRHVYTLNVTGDEPDFRLIAMPVNQAPDAVTLPRAGSQAYALFVWRLRGFAGDITLTGEKLPDGVTMQPQFIPGNQKQSAFVVSANSDAPATVQPINITGAATINGRQIIREVRGASITWPVPQQQNIPMIARLDREVVLAVRDKAPFDFHVEKDRFIVLQGEKLVVPVQVAFGAFKGPVTLTALTTPTGMVMQPVTVAPGKDTVQANLESKGTVSPGTYTVILRGQTQDPKGKPPTKPGGPANLVQAVPPITVTVVPKQLAKLVVPANFTVQVDKEVELLVRLDRQLDYTGAFKVEMVLPPNAKGFTAEPVTIMAGGQEAILIVRALPDAMVGQSQAIVIRATTLFQGTLPVIHEAKVTVMITK